MRNQANNEPKLTIFEHCTDEISLSQYSEGGRQRRIQGQRKRGIKLCRDTTRLRGKARDWEGERTRMTMTI